MVLQGDEKMERIRIQIKGILSFALPRALALETAKELINQGYEVIIEHEKSI